MKKAYTLLQQKYGVFYPEADDSIKQWLFSFCLSLPFLHFSLFLSLFLSLRQFLPDSGPLAKGEYWHWASELASCYQECRDCGEE